MYAMNRVSSIFLLTLFLTSLAHADQEIRIAIGTPLSSVALTGTDLVATSAEGKPLAKATALRLSAERTGIAIDGKKTDTQIIKISSTGAIRFDKRDYRNALEVKLQLDAGSPKLTLVHPLPLETYVVGIVSSEVGSSWPLEALKAQAIAARTYAVFQKFRRLDKNYHMESSVLDQVYGGSQKEHALADKAAQETYGQVLTYEGKPTQAYFHANCGGHTESAQEAWGNSLPYLPGSTCGYCNTAAKYKWNYSLSRSELNRALKSAFGSDVSGLRVSSKTNTGRAKSIEVKGKHSSKTISAATFREALGYNSIRSTLIDDISFGSREVSFSGRGHGHGVGMCQWGALGMAKAGKTAVEILGRYYPGAEIRRLY
jgi:stage II sporulation protein D